MVGRVYSDSQLYQHGGINFLLCCALGKDRAAKIQENQAVLQQIGLNNTVNNPVKSAHYGKYLWINKKGDVVAVEENEEPADEDEESDTEGEESDTEG